MLRVAMASLSLLPLIVSILLLFCGPSSCQNLQEASMKWAQISSQPDPSALRALLGLPSLLRTALEEALQEATPSGSFMNCFADLANLVEKKQSVKLIGNTTIDVPGIVLLLDAAGKPPAGLLQGAYSFRGNMEECQLITIPMDHSSEMYYGYLSLKLYSNTTKQPAFPPLSEELCLPSSCNSSFIKFVLTQVNSKLVSTGMYVDLISYTGLSMKSQPLTVGAIVMIVVCSFILLLVLVGTAVDVLWPMVNECREMRWRRYFRLKAKSFGDSDVRNSESDPLLGHKQPGSYQRIEQFLYEVVTAFSLYKNIPMILATHQPAAAITSLNGVRVISMFWVILCHVYFFLLVYIVV